MFLNESVFYRFFINFLILFIELFTAVQWDEVTKMAKKL